ncbi:AAA family ATPase [Pseudoalteromonas piscicida]|uniref:AAA family ATPase n=1 Tax=Pseudoalteromonas piscicida TaxID=43662 RepID=UPI003094E242
MDGFSDVLKRATEEINSTKDQAGTFVLLTGESGIGKSYLANALMQRIREHSHIVMVRGLPTESSSYSVLFDGVINSISKANLFENRLKETLLKYANTIPGFKKYIPEDFIEGDVKTQSKILTQSGISEDISISRKIINLLKVISGNKKIVICCDDLQWVDLETWRFFSEVVSSVSTSSISLVLIYNDKVPTWVDRICYIPILDHWHSKKNEPRHLILDANRWKKEDLPELSGSILNSTIEISEVNLDTLFKYTSGIPRLVRETLYLLIDKNLIVAGINGYQAIKTWNEKDIHDDLKKSIETNLVNLYRKVPESQSILELASVFGQEFRDIELDGVLRINNSKDVLSRIESDSEYIRYIFSDRHWMFDHSLIYYSIYNSLGKDVQTLHKSVGDYLSSLEVNAPLTIAHHYEIAGCIKESILFRFLEAKKLFDESLFGPSLYQLDKLIPLLFLHKVHVSNDIIEKANLLKSKCLYYLCRYNDAIEHLEKCLHDEAEPISVAYINRWIGKCYLNLDTSDSFVKSINKLNSAARVFSEKKLLLEQGETYADLVIAYAHNNQFKEAKEKFLDAEEIFSELGNIEGHCRLQRKNILFFDSELSASIQLSISDTFRTLNMPHERIMALNNGATKLLYLNRLCEAKDILITAREESAMIDNFGSVHIYNNLALIAIINGDYEKARGYLGVCGKFNTRNVEQFIISVNHSVANFLLSPSKDSLHAIECSIRRAESIGEKVLIMPTKLNLVWGLLILDELKRASEYLDTIPLLDDSYSDYEYKNNKLLLLKELVNSSRSGLSLLPKITQVDSDNNHSNTLFSLIDLQFWSD